MWVVLACGGSGSRFGSPQGKQLARLDGRPLFSHASKAFFAMADIVEGIVIVAGKSLVAEAEMLIEELQPECGVAIAPAGTERADSVRIGLASVPPGVAEVAVHDGARPFPTRDLVERLIAALADDSVAGAVPGLPVKDTVKECRHGLVASTVPREGLFVVQTPQLFRAEALRDAYIAAGDGASACTDEASLVEAAGGRVAIVPGDEENMKVTTPADMRLAEWLIGERA